MMSPIETIFEKEIDTIKETVDVATLEALTSYTLADAIRGGAAVTDQAQNAWGSAGQACALTSAAIHIQAMRQK